MHHCVYQKQLSFLKTCHNFHLLIRSIFVATKMYKSQYMEKSVVSFYFHNVIKTVLILVSNIWASLFNCDSSAQQTETSTFPVQSHHPVGASFIKCVQVLVVISVCLSHQWLHNFIKKQMNMPQWGRVLLYIVPVFCLKPPGTPVNLCYYKCIRSTLCMVSQLCVSCLCPIILFTVTLRRRNVFIIRCVGTTESKINSCAMSLTSSFTFKVILTSCTQKECNKLGLKLWHLQLTHSAVYNFMKYLVCARLITEIYIHIYNCFLYIKLRLKQWK